MGDGNYEVRWNVMSWGHGTFGAHEVGGLLWTHDPLSNTTTNHGLLNMEIGQ